MSHAKAILVSAVAAVVAASSMAAPTASEVAQLGKTLTPLGAQKEGNSDGSIPEWTGGLCTPPAGYKPQNGVSGSPYVDPFAAEKPLYTVTAANLAQHADKLDEGQKHLLKLYPQSFRVDVYKTHRTACYPDWVYENTIKGAMNPKLVGDAPGLQDAHAQFPFPIPKTGHEAMYNYIARYRPVNHAGDFQTWLVDAAGNKTQVTRASVRYRLEYWDTTKTSSTEMSALLNRNLAPAAKAGSMEMRIQYVRMDQKDPLAWTYTTGQRRVRLAPEFSYDTVTAQYGGLLVNDEIAAFDGKMDRFDFKLMGKQELLIPYNAYKFVNAPMDQQLTKNHHNPDLVRHELHRVWKIEATRKPGARHIYSKKVFFIDEDSWNIVSYQAYDDAGKLYRTQFFPVVQGYEVQTPWNNSLLAYDFVKNAWALGSVPVGAGWRKSEPLPVNYFTPDSMAGMGVR